MTESVRYKEGYDYQLQETISIPTPIALGYNIMSTWVRLSDTGVLTIYRGYCWDGASGGIDTKDSMRGSLAHDALYQLMREGKLDERYREQADKLLEDLCIEDGMSHFRARYWRRAVEWFGKKNAKKGTERPVLTAP